MPDALSGISLLLVPGFAAVPGARTAELALQWPPTGSVNSTLHWLLLPGHTSP